MILDKFPNYSNAQLRTLSHVTAQVLSDTVAAPEDTIDASPLAAAKQVLPDVQKLLGNDVNVSRLQNLLSDERVSSELATTIIDQVREDPYMAEKINEAYDQQQNKMTV